MSLPRHPSRHVHATAFSRVSAHLAANGWVTPPINFGSSPVALVDYQPDERGVQIAPNTVAISTGDVGDDVLEELGGGVYSRAYPIFIDIYGEKQSISEALADDCRDAFPLVAFPLIDQTTGLEVPGALIDVDKLLGPERAPGGAGLDQVKRYWRIMRIQLIVTYSL